MNTIFFTFIVIINIIINFNVIVVITNGNYVMGLILCSFI